MRVVLSPAKSLDLTSALPPVPVTRPRHAARAWELVKILRTRSPADLGALMHISDELAALNATRYAAFRARPGASDVRPAVATFAGDVYQGLDAWSLSPSDLEFAQGSIRILSGLYGVLQPLDGIQPYRLEMGTPLVTSRGSNLYEFWRDTVTADLRRGLDRTDAVVDLASQEYFGAVDPRTLGRRIVECVFTDEGPSGGYRIVSFFAKRARGLMARYIVTERLTDVAGLPGFDLGGYAYAEDVSTPDRLVFRRSRSAKDAAAG
ncbi:peroxide stress protein YaaA [Propionicicella superfundia]|uniref:peroxide stress protein YaaA n=1 Tax=Propionicicella superfundia TaxID=348582 RepID=UPI000412090D|nr:peroxide stress protein YaaA [Propionicicella superfundia]